MTQLTADTMARIAALAHLGLEDAALARYAEQARQILDFVAQLNAVDTANVPPMPETRTEGTPLADDRTVAHPAHDAILGNAPSADGRYFTVPKVIG